MRSSLLTYMLSFYVCFAFCQSTDRVEVTGKIIVSIGDVEGVTVFNASSNKGTITNAKGEFKIKVALNDKIEVSALQFIPFKLSINQDVIDSNTLKVYLVERVNNLDEVVILPYGLTGFLQVDTKNTIVMKPVSFSFGSFNDFDMSDDYHSGVENIAIAQSPKYLADFGQILKLIVPSLFKKRSKEEKRAALTTAMKEPEVSKLFEEFQDEYFNNNYGIPKDKVGAFILFLENESFDVTLLRPENEMKLIEALQKKSKLFLKQGH